MMALLKTRARDEPDAEMNAAWHEAWESTELSPEDLAELDDQAEIEELTRLEGMEVLEYRVREDVEEATQWVVWEGQACGQAVVCLRRTPSARRVWPHWRGWCRSWRRSGRHRSTLWTLRTVVTAPRSYVNNKFGVTKTWKLGRVLPGQRRGAQEWYHQLADDLLCPRSRPSTQMHPLRTWPPRALRRPGACDMMKRLADRKSRCRRKRRLINRPTSSPNGRSRARSNGTVRSHTRQHVAPLIP